MVKIIFIKSPDEWTTTKQTCRDELVVYLSISSHNIYICFPLQIDVLECIGKHPESREIKLRWNSTFCYGNVKSYLAKWYHSWSTKQTCLLGGRVQRRNWIRWLQWEQQNFALSAKWFKLLFSFLHLSLFIHHWVDQKLDLQIWCLQWNCCKRYIIVPRRSLWTRGIWQLPADMGFVKQ